jgi:hypothetical protein
MMRSDWFLRVSNLPSSRRQKLPQKSGNSADEPRGFFFLQKKCDQQRRVQVKIKNCLGRDKMQWTPTTKGFIN